MAIETWPAPLQDKINQAGFGYEFGDTVLRSENEVGPKKVRRQYTTGVDTQTCAIRLNRSEYSTFENFFKTTLNGGATPFYFIHPISQIQAVWRFVGVPKLSILGGNEFTVSMTWEQIIE